MAAGLRGASGQLVRGLVALVSRGQRETVKTLFQNKEENIVWESDGSTGSVTPRHVNPIGLPSETFSVLTLTLCHTRASYTSGRQLSTK
ncbi:hypothetical protein AMECASPLE_031364, partial [Ameca splendens]